MSKYFDTIPHGELMKSVARRVVDRDALHLIKMWLKAAVEEREQGGQRRITGGQGNSRGSPQSGVLSPLLANVYMNVFLKYWRRTGRGEAFGASVVNYADDFVILSRQNAAKALDWTRQVMARLGLTLNDAKTSIREARSEEFNFLGYTFGPHRYRKDGHWYWGARPSKKSVSRIKQAVAELLGECRTAPWEEVRDRLNRKLKGWSGYFSYGTRLMAYGAVDNYVYQAVPAFLRRRHKIPTRATARFSRQAVFGALGVLQLRRVHLGPLPCASR